VTGAAWALLGVAAAVAAGDWFAVSRGSKGLEYVCKPAAVAALIGVALALTPAHADRRAWFVVALALSLVGDVFLMLRRDFFVAGLGAFLLAHVAYVVGLRLHGGSWAALAWAAVVVGAAAVAVGRPVVGAVRRRQPDMVVPVSVYMAVISAMVASALATGVVLAALGAVLFELSDSLIAWNRFVRPLRWAPLAIIVTYHLGQAGLVLSLTR
jgi:uncharacterized membrane protein YhhN